MAFVMYSDNNPPKRGTARKIYKALKAHSLKVWDLHYNPNCWGQGGVDGWGTWACGISNNGGILVECWCGWDEKRGAYLEGNRAPYTIVFLSDVRSV